MPKFTSKPLSLIISASLLPLLNSGAFAQQGDVAEAINEILITGSPIRDSQKAAIEAKRNARNYVDIVSADTIGRFPDQNLADSLGRLPGLAIERDQGQARYINFRGAPFRYTTLAVDGINIPGAENGRIPRFDSFPSVITRRIEANKAILPSMPGEAVAGYINIESFNPFDSNGLSLSTDIGLGNQNLGDGDMERYGARLSWSNETIGVSVFGSHNSRDQITDNREYDLEVDPTTGQRVLNEIDLRSYKVTREDTAYGGRLEFRPQGSQDRYFLSSLYSEFQDHEQRNQFVFDLEGGAAAVGAPQVVGDSAYQPLALVSRFLEDGLYENSSFTNTLGADNEVGGWFIESRLNYTQTTNDFFLPIPLSAGGTAAVSFDISDTNNPLVTLSKAFSQTPMNLADVKYAANRGILVGSALDIDAWKWKIDADRDGQLFGQTALFEIGLEHDSREALGYGLGQEVGFFPDSVDLAAYNTGKPWDSDFTNSIGGTYYDNKGARAAWAAASANGLGITAPPADQLIRIDETITAGYAMSTIEYQWGQAIVGARVENTDYNSQGPQAKYDDSFTHVLPSAHINIDLREDLKLRLSATSSISRPTYTEWRASATINPVDSSVSGGNPRLDPEEAWGSDVSLEWYYGDASLLSAGAFFRDIDNVIYADSTTIDGGLYLPSAAGQNWSYTGFVNGKSGELRGIELNLIGQASDFIPGLLDGFGLSGNITLLDSEFTTLSGANFSLPGTSDAIYNASVYYETDRFSIRLNYQYRDAWLSTTENDSMAEYWDAQERVDLSMKYDLPFNLLDADVSVYANANNLTDAVDVRYVESTYTPNQVERYGRSFLVGVRVGF